MPAAPAVVAGLDDVAVVGETNEQRSRHLGVPEHLGPFGRASARRPSWRSSFASISSLLARTTALKKRVFLPALMMLRAIPMAMGATNGAAPCYFVPKLPMKLGGRRQNSGIS